MDRVVYASVAAAGGEDESQRLLGRPSPHLVVELRPGLIGHAHVAEDGVVLVRAKVSEGITSHARCVDVVLRAELPGEGERERSLVVDDENAGQSSRQWPGVALRNVAGVACRAERKNDVETRPAMRATLDADLTADPADEIVRDGEAEPSPTTSDVRLEERVEDARERPLVDPDSVVLYRDVDGSVSERRADSYDAGLGDRAAPDDGHLRIDGLRGVHEEVDERVTQAHECAGADGKLPEVDVEARAPSELAGGQRQCGLQDAIQVDGAGDRSLPYPGEELELADDARDAARRFGDVARNFLEPCSRRGVAALQRGHQPGDLPSGERDVSDGIVDLVRYACGKPAERGQSVGLHDLLPRLDLGRDVVGDQLDALHRAVAVEDRVSTFTKRESASVRVAVTAVLPRGARAVRCPRARPAACFLFERVEERSLERHCVQRVRRADSEHALDRGVHEGEGSRPRREARDDERKVVDELSFLGLESHDSLEVIGGA